MHGSMPVRTHPVRTTTIDSRTFADWEDAKGAEMLVANLLTAEQKAPRRSLQNPAVRLDLARLVRMCQRATVAADPQSRTRVAAHRIPGVRYVACEDRTMFELYFSTAAAERGQASMILDRPAEGEWTIRI